MRQPLVIANWKLNGDLELVNEMVSALTNDSYVAQVVICPPAPLISALRERVMNTTVAVGAQDCSQHKQGAYTGEISAAMLKEAGSQYVLVGHSERRSFFGESNEIVAAKLRAAQEENLIPVLCVGETLQQRENGDTMVVVEEQLRSALSAADLRKLVVAYEPVWAIGTGLAATPEQAQEVHQHIRVLLAQLDASQAQQVPLLYGGSVKPETAEVLFAQDDIDGGLIGGASLVTAQFRAICAAVKG